LPVELFFWETIEFLFIYTVNSTNFVTFSEILAIKEFFSKQQNRNKNDNLVVISPHWPMAPQPYWPLAVMGAFVWKKGLSLDPFRSSDAGSRPIDKVTETEIFGSEDRLQSCHILLTASLGPYRTCKALHSLVDSLHIISSSSYSQ
jgi:hypothetical protein